MKNLKKIELKMKNADYNAEFLYSPLKIIILKAMVMKLDTFLCHMFWLLFLALTLHKPR